MNAPINPTKTEEVNAEFYNKLYKKRNVLFQLIYPFISYDQQSKSKYNYSYIKSLIQSSGITSNFKYMDYGFGHGSLLLKLPFKDGLFGCDISIEAVANFPRVAKLLGKNVTTFTPAKFEASEIKMNLISLSHVLEHVNDDHKLLSEIFSKLEDKGHVLINVPINEVWEDPKHVRKYTPESMKKLLEDVGFKVLSINEENKLSGYLLINERVKKPGFLKRIMYRMFRLFMALMPLSLIKRFDKILGDKYQYQHLIAIAQKNG